MFKHSTGILSRTVSARSPTLVLRTFTTKAPKIYTFDQVRNLVEHPNDKKLLVDVREPKEVKDYKMPTTINIPVNSAPGALGLPEKEFHKVFQFAKPPHDKELIFLCAKGVRAKTAEELARSYGYENTGIYPGSITQWLAKGGADVKPKK
ncbi:CDG_1a_G0051820.mRNA.1.CDS.1 [Saccharomyces cerevisiae]|nr:CDG_1a_G0051820.mRNA.1.CDS.1 [Saccharomyces cerevisiae]CAI7468856.1 CDG_1a_G0051820.mRNA.1.CDS.1 [Saccharomyces cerevisiae]